MSLALREERILRLFGNRLLRRIFGPKRDGATREWKKLHNEELSDLYSSPNSLGYQTEKNEMGGHVACMRDKTGENRVLVGRPGGKRILVRPRRRQEIKMDLQKVGWGSMAWIVLVLKKARWRALVDAVLKLRVP